MSAYPVSPDAWRAAGHWLPHAGRKLFVARYGTGPMVLALHAFPTASYDFCKIIARLQNAYTFIVFDYPGFGFSDKPCPHPYSLFEYADAAQAVCAHFGLTRYHLLAHDIGDSVALELLRRNSSSGIASLTLINGSVWSIPFSDWRLRLPQWLSLHPHFGPLISRWRLFRQSTLRDFFRRIFVRQLTTAEVAAFWSLIAYNDGAANYHALLGYMPERWQHQRTWLAALAQHPAPLTLIWGMADPVATPAVADVVLQHRPDAHYLKLEKVGHYPHWEVPEVVAEALAATWRKAGSNTDST